jgi:hypothetical protein
MVGQAACQSCAGAANQTGTTGGIAAAPIEIINAVDEAGVDPRGRICDGLA